MCNYASFGFSLNAVCGVIITIFFCYGVTLVQIRFIGHYGLQILSYEITVGTSNEFHRIFTFLKKGSEVNKIGVDLNGILVFITKLYN